MFLLTMINAYEEEDLSTDEKQDSRTVLRLHPCLAPLKAAIFPLTKKDGLPEKAREIMDKLKLDFNIQYEEKGCYWQALPPPGCYRYAILYHGRPSDIRRQHRNHTPPRYHGAGTRTCRRP
jgi:hypothetical protein